MNSDSDELQFHCPNCDAIVAMDFSTAKCEECAREFLVDGDIYDFVGVSEKAEERGFYDSEYGRQLDGAKRYRLNELEQDWVRPDLPQNYAVRRIMGNIHGKTVLVLGNGVSRKELALLKERPRRFVYSDLSPYASMRMKRTVDISGYESYVRFAAIDAENIPFVDNSIDLIYAYGMVHHLPDLERFFSDAFRVLKPNGKTVFMDDGYNPVWHCSKQTWLRPLMQRSHSTTGISPEDYRFSMSGGFREDQLSEQILAVGGKPFFERTAFVGYLVVRGAEKLLPAKASTRLKTSVIPKMALAFDNFMAKFPFYDRNQLRLIWGFRK